MGKFAQAAGTRSTLSDGLGGVHAGKNRTQDRRLSKREPVVLARAGIRQSRICGFVRPGGRQLWLGRPQRVETGPSGQSGTAFSNAARARRSNRSRFFEGADSRSRTSVGMVELR